MDPKTQTTRDAVLQAAMRHVPFDGWTDRAMAAAAEDAGVAADQMARAFPKGVADLFTHFIATADRRMLAVLNAQDLTKLRIRERVALAVRARLEQSAATREVSRRAAAYLMLPQNVGLGAAATWRDARVVKGSGL